MSVRQYIGARYVPKFFENSATGDSTWASNTAYEPLTIVTWNGNSYTSKKTVPSGVGNPSANAEYWASTGMFNAQVEELREYTEEIASDLADTNAEVSILKNRKFIFVGDSYATEPDATHGWGSLVPSYLGLTSGQYYFTNGYGYRFAENEGTNTFLSLIQSLNVSNPETITDIWVIGGYNDRYSSQELTLTGIQHFVTYCKTNFPNATVFIVECGLSKDVSIRESINRQSYRAYVQCGVHGAVYVGGAEMALHNTLCFQEDGYHPSQYGSFNLAAVLASMIKGRCEGHTYYESKAVVLTPVEGVSSVPSIYSIVDNTNITVMWGLTNVAFSSARTISGNQDIDIGTVGTNTNWLGGTDMLNYLPVTLNLGSTFANAYLYITNGGTLRLHTFYFGSEITNVSTIYFTPSCYSFNGYVG